MSLQTIAERRSVAVTKPLQQCSLAELLDHPIARQRIAEAAARHINPDRMLRVLAQAARATPDLAKCTPLSLLGAVMTCASLGVEPNTLLGHAYLIPFNRRGKVGATWQDVKEVQLVVGYRGFIDLARRSGLLVSIHADCVYPGDEFSYEYGSQMHLRHKPRGAGEGVWSDAYAHARLTDGEAFEVLPRARVLRIRDQSQGWQAYQRALARAREDNRKPPPPSPWESHEHEMAAKTLIRRLAKVLPLSIEMQRAQEVDERSVDYREVVERGVAAIDLDGAPLIEEGSSDEASEPAREPAPTPAAAVSAPAKRPRPVVVAPEAAPPAPSEADALISEIARELADGADLELTRRLYADALDALSPEDRERVEAVLRTAETPTPTRSALSEDELAQIDEGLETTLALIADATDATRLAAIQARCERLEWPRKLNRMRKVYAALDAQRAALSDGGAP